MVIGRQGAHCCMSAAGVVAETAGLQFVEDEDSGHSVIASIDGQHQHHAGPTLKTFKSIRQAADTEIALIPAAPCKPLLGMPLSTFCNLRREDAMFSFDGSDFVATNTTGSDDENGSHNRAAYEDSLIAMASNRPCKRKQGGAEHQAASTLAHTASARQHGSVTGSTQDNGPASAGASRAQHNMPKRKGNFSDRLRKALSMSSDQEAHPPDHCPDTSSPLQSR